MTNSLKPLFTVIIPLSLLIGLLHETGYFLALDFQIFTVVSVTNIASALISKIPSVLVSITISAAILKYLSTDIFERNEDRKRIYKIKDSWFGNRRDIDKLDLEEENISKKFKIENIVIYIMIVITIPFGIYQVSKNIKYTAIIIILQIALIYMQDSIKNKDRKTRVLFSVVPQMLLAIILYGYLQGISDLRTLSEYGPNAHLTFFDKSKKDISLLREYTDTLLLIEEGAIITHSKANIQAVVYAPIKTNELDPSEKPGQVAERSNGNSDAAEASP